MLPFFKSDYSIGKSILNLNLPKEDKDPDSSDSIFDIALDHDFKSLILVEDSLSGFLQAFKNAQSLGLNLIFGLRVTICNDSSVAPKLDKGESDNKIIIFAKNSAGCKLLNKIYSKAFTEGYGRLDYKTLANLFSNELDLVIPFYDSFIYNNTLYFKSCIPDFSFCEPKFVIESNSLPFDHLIEDKVRSYCKDNNLNIIKGKSIYYKNRSDFESYQSYKCICSRSFSSRSSTLEKPNLDHCSSSDFSFESYLENEAS
jgi:DNA polymerase III alpha subunit|tara:strand:- start:54 stop:824 length:771 start_codon:yes stop_codon:yes gene_type:complete